MAHILSASPSDLLITAIFSSAFCTFQGSRSSRLPALFHDSIRVGARLQEEFDSLDRRSHRTCFQQGSLAVFCRLVDMSAPRDKSLDDLCVAIARGCN